MRKFLLLIVVVALGLVSACTAAPPDSHQATCRTWNGFRTTFWLRADAGIEPFEQLVEHAGQVCIAQPFAYQVETASTVTALITPEQLKLAQAAQSQGVLLLPTLVDETPDATADMLKKPAGMVASLTQIVLDNGYDGLNLDLEAISLAVTDDGSRDQLTDDLSPLFSAFVKLLAESLHEHNKLLSVAVMTRSAPDDWAGARFYDYQAIGTYADAVQVMAYDEHWGVGEPGPTAELEWAHNAFMYAIDVAPGGQIPPEKVWLGMPFYGYVYGGDGQHDVMQSRLAELAPTGPVTRPDAEVTYVHHDPDQKIDQIVWFNDPCSTRIRVDNLAHQLEHHKLSPGQIGGIAIYPLSSPSEVNPGHWEALSGKEQPSGSLTDQCILPPH